jgi:DNA-binding HxlR family transcriptional regulator
LDTGRADPGYELPGAAGEMPEAAGDLDAACAAAAAACEAEAAGEMLAIEAVPPGAPGRETRAAGAAPITCRAREVLQRVGDKWSVLAIDLLGQGTMRFTELHRAIDGITARMLTVTLRGLERDGIVTRTIHPVIPPRVEYALTPMGRTLLNTIGQLVSWTDSHLPEIEAARAAYDARHPAE